MTYQRAVLCFAGLMVLLSIALTQLVNPNFIWLTVFVGANLMQFSITKFCPAAWFFKRIGLKSECDN